MDAARGRWLALCVGCVVVFALLAMQVQTNGPLATALDLPITAWLAAHRTPALTAVLLAVTEVHSTLGIDLMLAAAVTFHVLRQRRWREALWLVVAVQSSMLLNVLMKYTFARPRPVVAEPLVHLSTFSFPSGHALASTVFWGCVVCLLPAAWQRAATVAAVLLVGVVCFTRVYLGAHFTTDVLAGVCEGLLCVGAWRLALPQRPAGAAR